MLYCSELQCGCNSVLTVNTGHSINVYFLMFHFVSFLMKSKQKTVTIVYLL